MRELHIDIKNKIATYNARCGSIVCGNNDYRIRFTFDEEWDEYSSKQVRFSWNGKYIDVVILGDSVPVPMLSQATSLTVGVYAGDKLYTTTPAKIPCMLSILCETDRAKPADYYEVNGTLEHRLPVITPADQGKLLQANNGVYELRTRAELTYNEDVSEIVKAVEDKVDAIAPYVTKITDLTGNTWPLKDALEITKDAEYHINFNYIAAGNQEYPEYHTLILSAPNRIYYQNDYGRFSPQYPNGDWLSSNYQTLVIHGGEDATNPELIDLLGAIAKSAPAYQTVGDQRLLTRAKTIVGAINELQNTTTIVKGYYDRDRKKWFSDKGMTNELVLNFNTGDNVAFQASLVNIAVDLNTGTIHMDKGNTTVEEIMAHSEWYQNVTNTVNEIQKWWKENIEDSATPFVDALWKEVQRILEQVFTDIQAIIAIPDRVTATENGIVALEQSLKSLKSNLDDLQTRHLELLNMVNNHYLRLEDIDTKNSTMLAGINELQAGVFGKVIDLTGSTWVWKNTIEAPTVEGTNRYYLKFISDGTEYSYIRHEAAYADGELILKLYYGSQLVYESDRGWEDGKYQTISVIGGSAVTNTDCIKLLYTNGELQFEADFMSPLQRKEDESLRTKDKTIVGAINEVNNKVVNTITELEDNHAYVITKKSTGVAWEGESRIHFGDGEYVDIVRSTNIPLVAGENVTFEVDQESDIVKVNAETDTSNLATVDKIRDIDSGYSHSTSFNKYGIVTEQDTTIYSVLDKVTSVDITFTNRLPIVAGENVTFELDEENQVVKINATGGGSAEDNVVGTWIFNYNLELTGGIDAYFNFTGYDADGVEREFNRLCINAIIGDGVLQDYCVEYYDIDGDSFLVCDTMDAFWINDMSRTITINEQPNDNDFITCVKRNASKKGAVSYVAKYVVSLSGGENVVNIINKLQEDYPDYQLGVWSLVEFTGATSGLYGLTINHYGGNLYNISGADFGTFYSMANNVKDWSQVSVWGFSGEFQPPIPYCDDSNNGQVLKVVNGVPTWVNP